LSDATSIYTPARHEPLPSTAWDEDVAARAIDDIVADAFANFHPTNFWPIHPLDRSPDRADALKSVYYSAAGVVLALADLDLADTRDRVSEAVLMAIDGRNRQDATKLYPHAVDTELMGRVGTLMLVSKLFPSVDIDQRLESVFASHDPLPPTGLVWGSAGMALAALLR
jgi:hypothetical protein